MNRMYNLPLCIFRQYKKQIANSKKETSNKRCSRLIHKFTTPHAYKQQKDFLIIFIQIKVFQKNEHY